MTRSVSVSKLFLLLLATTFVLVVIFALRFTYKFAQFSAEASRLTANLQDTSALNLNLRDKLSDQINLVYTQFKQLDSGFPVRFGVINFELGESQTRYLKLNLGNEERLTVERIKVLQSELGVQALQIYYQLRADNRTQAVLGLRDMKDLENHISYEFASLNDLQTRKLHTVQDQLNETVSITNQGIYILAGCLLVSLLTFTILLRRRVLQPLQLILEATNQIRKGDFSARAPDGRDELGQLAHSFNFMAASLTESYATLEGRVAERTRQLTSVQQQLVQAEKMSAVGRMVSGVAHELNNPLAVIMGHTELAQRRLIARDGDAATIKLMGTLHEQGDRCRKIVANLLQFARQEKPTLEAVKLNQVVEQALQLREYELKTRNIQIVREYDATDPAFCADPNKIVQVVLNLLNNAHDAICETKRPGTILIRTSSEADQVRLEFLDSGTGVSEPERVFDPFYTTKDVGQGTGLGLSVCYGIVEEHGGTIRAENWEQGARFVITLPIGDPAMLAQACKLEDEPPLVQRKSRALVVDDEAPLVQMQTSFLADIGVEADGACSGADAISYLQANQVDLIISDVRMPGSVDGIQLYHWVEHNRPELLDRFLFVSGDMLGLNLGEFFSNSPVRRIQKPFEWDDYSNLVTQMLENGAEAR